MSSRSMTKADSHPSADSNSAVAAGRGVSVTWLSLATSDCEAVHGLIVAFLPYCWQPEPKVT